jgi:hypothetical protein
MTEKDDDFAKVYEDIGAKFKPMHYLRLKGLLDEKIVCFRSHSKDPVSYYECFDKIERKVIKDIKLMKGWL